MTNDILRKALVTYIATYLSNLAENDIPFEYYYLNKNHPQCTIENMSDYEIAYKYVFSGERLVLDCWSLAVDYGELTDEDWESFVRVIDDLVTASDIKYHSSNN